MLDDFNYVAGIVPVLTAHILNVCYVVSLISCVKCFNSRVNGTMDCLSRTRKHLKCRTLSRSCQTGSKMQTLIDKQRIDKNCCVTWRLVQHYMVKIIQNMNTMITGVRAAYGDSQVLLLWSSSKITVKCLYSVYLNFFNTCCTSIVCGNPFVGNATMSFNST